MTNKKGFTLIELLAVIVLIAIVLTLAVPSVLFISKKMKERLYNTKIDMVEKAGRLYGNDNQDDISNCETVQIHELIANGYVETDNALKEFLDPRNNRNMRCDEVKICVKRYPNGNVKVTATATQVKDPDGVNAMSCDKEG